MSELEQYLSSTVNYFKGIKVQARERYLLEKFNEWQILAKDFDDELEAMCKDSCRAALV